MAWSTNQIILIPVLILAASLFSLAHEWTTKRLESQGLEQDRRRFFEHPYLMSWFIFAGQFLCLPVYYFVRYLYDRRNQELEGGDSEYNWFVWLPAMLMNWLVWVLYYIGLNLTFAQSSTMLWGVIPSFTGLLHVAFLGRRLTGLMFLGMFIMLVGEVLVGLSDALFGFLGEDFIDMNAVVAGCLLILIALMVVAGLVVYEERCLTFHNVHPLMGVGLEGLFGFVINGLLLIAFYFIPSMTPFTSDPNLKLENSLDGFEQMKNNKLIIVGVVGCMLSTAVYLSASFGIAKENGATNRMVIDICRTLPIWVVRLCLGWQQHNLRSLFCQIGGFLIMALGLIIYSDIILAPFLRRHGCLSNVPDGPDPDAFVPMPDPQLFAPKLNMSKRAVRRRQRQEREARLEEEREEERRLSQRSAASVTFREEDEEPLLLSRELSAVGYTNDLL